MAIFDIGSNNGLDGLSLAIENLDCHVYAFEPVPEMRETIDLNHSILSQKFKITNFTVIPKAVSDYTGSAVFNVAGQSDWGCSSLNQFTSRDKLQTTWPGRHDLVFSDEVNCEVTTLESFIDENSIGLVRYIHCDAQGSDLKVLRGLGKNRSKCISGVFEIASTPLQALYSDADTLEDAFSELREWRFLVKRIGHNDPWCNEVNVHWANPQSLLYDESLLIENNRTAHKLMKTLSSNTAYSVFCILNKLYQMPVILAKRYLLK